MGVYIPNMEKPSCCYECRMGDDEYASCNLTGSIVGLKGLTKRADDCPLIEIPTPHGRLIDGDELADIVDGTDWYHINRKGELVHGAGVEDEALYKADDILTTVNNFPTIIEAEE